MAITHDTVFKDAVMVRTYCRDIQNEDGHWRKEYPNEVWNRVINSFKKYYKEYLDVLPEGWEEDWYDRMSSGKALPAGRMLWAMGSKTIEEEGYLPMMNCAFVAINDPIKPLVFIMKMLMLGCGVGFSLERKHFKGIFARQGGLRTRWYDEREKDFHIEEVTTGGYQVQDSRHGWTDFLIAILTAAQRYITFKFNLSGLRPAGSRIKGFGGRSGDPKILSSIAKRIYNLLTDPGQIVPSKEVYYDVICSIGELVVSGNVRRSALIAIGDPDDLTFLSLKKFSSLATRPWRVYCNNSVNVEKFEDLSAAYWATYSGDSEAYGWVNIKKCQEDDLQRFPGGEKSPAIGFNPCGEQPLANREVCCLGEVNLSRAESYEDLLNSMKMCYFFCKYSFLLTSTEPETDEITRKNQRIGISLTGIAMVEDYKREWAYRAKIALREFDTSISNIYGFRKSVALTTVKPGGTLPKIAGSSGPGIHRPFSNYQIRRVRFPRGSKLLTWLSQMGIPIEPQINFDGEPDPSGTMVASFYLKNEIPSDGKWADWLTTEEGFISFMELISEVQRNWSENAISVTVYYDIEKIKSVVIPAIEKYFDQLKVFSGLPYYGHNFPQAPEEPITEEQYNNFVNENPVKNYRICTEIDNDNTHPEDFGQCEAKGNCSDR
jgi:ribonucleoside-triphosphate reductase